MVFVVSTLALLLLAMVAACRRNRAIILTGLTLMAPLLLLMLLLLLSPGVVSVEVAVIVLLANGLHATIFLGQCLKQRGRNTMMVGRTTISDELTGMVHYLLCFRTFPLVSLGSQQKSKLE